MMLLQYTILNIIKIVHLTFNLSNSTFFFLFYNTFIHSPHFFHIHTKHLEMIIVQRQVHPTSGILSSITNNTVLMLASESVVLVSSTNVANVVTSMILVNVFSSFILETWNLRDYICFRTDRHNVIIMFRKLSNSDLDKTLPKLESIKT